MTKNIITAGAAGGVILVAAIMGYWLGSEGMFKRQVAPTIETKPTAKPLLAAGYASDAQCVFWPQSSGNRCDRFGKNSAPMNPFTMFMHWTQGICHDVAMQKF